MDAAVFAQFREIVYKSSGIALSEGKESLVSARVAKRMRSLGLASHEEYLKYLRNDKTQAELVQLLDVISTNVTSFFRESDHFDFLTQLVSGWLAGGQRRFRFWSAASSTGEEPYTLAMVINEALRGYEVDWKILATDISTRVLDACRQGVYRQASIKTIPERLVKQYFEARKTGPDGEKEYAVKNELKSHISFQRLNLSTPPFPMNGPFDVVMCRNVMIYFDNHVRGNLLAEAYRLIKPGGFLMVGHAESLTGMMSRFKTVRPSIYSKD
jgi:chemotaxis protein methyltransferase CheR